MYRSMHKGIPSSPLSPYLLFPKIVNSEIVLSARIRVIRGFFIRVISCDSWLFFCGCGLWPLHVLRALCVFFR